MSSTSDPAFDPKAQITNAAALLLSRVQPETSTADMAAAVDKATAALRFAADIEMNALTREKIDQEIRKLKDENATMLERQRWDGRRNFIIAITPILTIVAFAIAQLLQSSQFYAKQNSESTQLIEKQQSERDQTLEADLKKAAENLSVDAKTSPISLAIVKQALDSPGLRESARDYVALILKKNTNANLLEEFFGKAFVPIGPSTFGSSEQANLRRLVEMSRELLRITLPIWEKARRWEEWRRKNPNEDPQNHPKDAEAVSFNEQLQNDYTYEASTRISFAVGRLLVSRPKDVGIEISRTLIVSSDWQGTNLEGADISGMRIVRVNLKDANLTGIEYFSDVFFQETAWWEVKSISSKLLDHLKFASPHNPGTQYGPELKSVSKSDYEAALKRIEVKPN